MGRPIRRRSGAPDWLPNRGPNCAPGALEARTKCCCGGGDCDAIIRQSFSSFSRSAHRPITAPACSGPESLIDRRIVLSIPSASSSSRAHLLLLEDDNTFATTTDDGISVSVDKHLLAHSLLFAPSGCLQAREWDSFKFHFPIDELASIRASF